jgi:hypothetical protein
MSGVSLISIGDLIMVKRRGKWVNATVKAIGVTGDRALVEFVDGGGTDTFSVYEMYSMQPGLQIVDKR